MKFNSTEELIEDLKAGKMIILVDDEDRENEGDLVLPAQFATDQSINFMALHARGLICLALAGQQVDRLGLKPMVGHDENQTPNKTAFTVSIEATQGVSTGISAADRAHTIRVASHPEARPQDLRVPGHIFPIRAQAGGVLKRAGHTEGSVDLMRLSGLWPSAVICEIMKEDGTMARVTDLIEFGQRFDLKIGTIADLIEYRLERDTFIKEVSTAEAVDSLLPGWQMRIFENQIDGWQHLVFQKGPIDAESLPLVRIQQDDYLRTIRDQAEYSESALAKAIKILEQEPSALLLLLRGYEKEHKLISRLAEKMQFQPAMDSRNYGVGAQILRSCGIQQFRLLTNSHEKRVGLKSFGLDLVETQPLPLG